MLGPCLHGPHLAFQREEVDLLPVVLSKAVASTKLRLPDDEWKTISNPMGLLMQLITTMHNSLWVYGFGAVSMINLLVLGASWQV